MNLISQDSILEILSFLLRSEQVMLALTCQRVHSLLPGGDRPLTIKETFSCFGSMWLYTWGRDLSEARYYKYIVIGDNLEMFMMYRAQIYIRGRRDHEMVTDAIPFLIGRYRSENILAYLWELNFLLLRMEDVVSNAIFYGHDSWIPNLMRYMRKIDEYFLSRIAKESGARGLKLVCDNLENVKLCIPPRALIEVPAAEMIECDRILAPVGNFTLVHVYNPRVPFHQRPSPVPGKLEEFILRTGIDRFSEYLSSLTEQNPSVLMYLLRRGRLDMLGLYLSRFGYEGWNDAHDNEARKQFHVKNWLGLE